MSMKAVVEVRQKGQITIPLNVRRALGIDVGDLVDVEIIKLEVKKGSPPKD